MPNERGPQPLTVKCLDCKLDVSKDLCNEAWANAWRCKTCNALRSRCNRALSGTEDNLTMLDADSRVRFMRDAAGLFGPALQKLLTEELETVKTQRLVNTMSIEDRVV